MIGVPLVSPTRFDLLWQETSAVFPGRLVDFAIQRNPDRLEVNLLNEVAADQAALAAAQGFTQQDEP